MPNVTIDPARCDASPLCPVFRACPRGAVTRVSGGYAIDQSVCTACGACIRVCPTGAVRLS